MGSNYRSKFSASTPYSPCDAQIRCMWSSSGHWCGNHILVPDDDTTLGCDTKYTNPELAELVDIINAGYRIEHLQRSHLISHVIGNFNVISKMPTLQYLDVFHMWVLLTHVHIVWIAIQLIQISCIYNSIFSI